MTEPRYLPFYIICLFLLVRAGLIGTNTMGNRHRKSLHDSDCGKDLELGPCHRQAA